MSPILDVVAPRLLAPAIMLAIALIVKGYAEVGEGFSAGVIVALAVGLRYVTLGRGRADRTLPFARRADVVATAGLLIAFAFGFAGLIVGQPPFTHLPLHGEPVISIGRLELDDRRRVRCRALPRRGRKPRDAHPEPERPCRRRPRIRERLGRRG